MRFKELKKTLDKIKQNKVKIVKAKFRQACEIFLRMICIFRFGVFSFTDIPRKEPIRRTYKKDLSNRVLFCYVSTSVQESSAFCFVLCLDFQSFYLTSVVFMFNIVDVLYVLSFLLLLLKALMFSCYELM